MPDIFDNLDSLKLSYEQLKNMQTPKYPYPVYDHHLTEDGHRFGFQLGHKRHYGKDESIRDSSISPSYKDSDIHIIGGIAEVGYSNCTGMPVNTEIYRLHGDLFDFGHIEIKAATHQYSDIDLKVRVDKYHKIRPDIYVLIHVPNIHSRLVRFIGSITRKEFDARIQKLGRSAIKNYGYVDNYYVPGSLLPHRSLWYEPKVNGIYTRQYREILFSELAKEKEDVVRSGDNRTPEAQRG